MSLASLFVLLCSVLFAVSAVDDVSNKFDESCWSIRNRLDTLPLDRCATPSQKQSVVVGTYNTLFLFDGVKDPRVQDVWEDTAAADAHFTKITEIIKNNRPDILGLQEVENGDMLTRLTEALGRPTYTPYFVQGKDTYTGQDVGLITQGIPAQSATRTNCRSGIVPGSSCGSTYSTTVGVSKNLITLFDSCLFGKKFAVIVIHFYAFPTAGPRCIRRESQARVIQDVIQQLVAADFEVIVMGDFNDYSDRYEDTLDQDPRSRVLSMMRDPNGDGIDELQNVMQQLSAEDRYSAWWDRDHDKIFDEDREGSMIDHILVTSHLYERVRRVWIDHSYVSQDVSDHWPVFVEMSTRAT